ncbi:hypothetical protein JCM19302_1456 [Jejuia pallidilutea]|uniref:Uncharacterized protein n=1 Tax=Jejuia pallidilutea TaxID=504487 RepID=A0A090WT27_9FLAO|nr:hypothetical protein JCM19302_1456 [Jejuia pallidilutea]
MVISVFISSLIKAAFFIPFIRMKYRIDVVAKPLKIAPYNLGLSAKLKDNSNLDIN